VRWPMVALSGWSQSWTNKMNPSAFDMEITGGCYVPT
jgi:hypothetical protein